MGTRRREAPPGASPSDEGAVRAPLGAGPPASSPLVLGLDDPRARDPGLAGAKAANLARAVGSGFPVLPGFVLTTAVWGPDRPWSPGSPLPAPVSQALRSAWERFAADDQPLVVRSSSTVEDVGASSMAGQFLSLLDIRGWDAFEAAVRDVLGSSARPAAGAAPAPMAVLVQRHLDAEVGGVMFGLDPVTGDRSHVLVEAVQGGPEGLVSGTVTSQRFLLGRRGRIVEGPAEDDGGALLDRGDRRRLVRLAAQADAAFGSPQDVEWAVDRTGALWLLQSRPVTAVGTAATQRGPLLGPGPVGETFPEPLRPLEEDLWLVPLRQGIAASLTVTGAVPQAQIAASPLVMTVGGRVACDLALIGASPEGSSRARLLDPRIGVRRLISAWRVGRLRTVLPGLAQQVADRVDEELGALGQLDSYSNAELLEVVQRARGYLVAVHGHEVLAGVLLQGGTGATAAGAAMRAIARGRDLGLTDAEIVVRWPVTLALTAPRLGSEVVLPRTAVAPERRPPASGAWTAELVDLPAREALRLRARWLQELSARAADLLIARLVGAHRIPEGEAAVHLRLAELVDVVAGWPVPEGLSQRSFAPGPQLPSCFRLDADGNPVHVRFGGSHRAGGRGASPGRAQGTTVDDGSRAEPGDILVVRTLDPRLAAWLPTVGGIVSETGSVLSHLAILAREYGVPTVVGVHDALERYPAGSEVVVDGGTGEVGIVAAERTEVPDVDG